MDKSLRCHLTAKDLNALEVMLERRGADNGPLSRLLRRKLSAAAFVYPDDIDPQTITINSRIEFQVDGGSPQTRILVYGGEDAFPGMALPITTMHGLALLGLTAPDTIHCERPDGSMEELALSRVLYQPESARRCRVSTSSGSARTYSIVDLDTQRRTAVASNRFQPENDDPGPQAA